MEPQLAFAGKALKTTTSHTKGGGAPIVTTDLFDYDHSARLKRQLQELGGHTELIAQNDYDGIGLLVKKDVGNSTGSPLQEVDYTYNIRGWLTGINDVDIATTTKLFNFGIAYNQPQKGADTLYNGNISETQWRTDNTDR